MRGAVATMPLVMPVRTAMNDGIGSPGLTRVCSSPSTSPPRTLTAPISVMPARRRGAAGGLEVDDDEGDVAQRDAEFVEGALDRDRAHTPDGRAVGRQFSDATRRPAGSGEKSARDGRRCEKCHCRS